MRMSSFGIFLRGLLMGAADIVPGVSGGTVAFITGIYDRLLGSIKSVDLAFARRVLRGDIAGAWQQIDGSFLLALVAGIGTSVLTLARVISWLLEQYPVPLWAAFFGLILASAFVLMREVNGWNIKRLASFFVGVGVAVYIALSPAMNLDVGLAGVFIAGFFAICAMILPGISGSFILVLMGMYSSVLAALKGFDVVFILVFAAGAGIGLMCFSRLLHWLLHRYRQATMALLTGFLFGSLMVVWPWKRVLSWVESRHGDLKPVQQVPVSPAQFEVYTGQEPQVVLCCLLAFAGFAVVWLIDRRWGSRAA